MYIVQFKLLDCYLFSQRADADVRYFLHTYKIVLNYTTIKLIEILNSIWCEYVYVVLFASLWMKTNIYIFNYISFDSLHISYLKSYNMFRPKYKEDFYLSYKNFNTYSLWF